MRRFMIPIIAISMAAAPAALSAQRGGVRAAPRAQAQQADPIERILQHRAELGLTAAQVTQLERVQSELRTQNSALLSELQAARPQGTGMRAGARQGATPPARGRAGAGAAMPRDSVQKLTEEQRRELRARSDVRRDSMRARADSLTPEQRARLREEMQARAGQRRPGAAGAGADAMRPAMEKVRANTEKAMEQAQSILTAEQRAKLRELRGDAPARRGARQR